MLFAESENIFSLCRYLGGHGWWCGSGAGAALDGARRRDPFRRWACSLSCLKRKSPALLPGLDAVEPMTDCQRLVVGGNPNLERLDF